MGAAFGLAAGGAAEGYRKQMAAMDAHKEQKAKQEARAREDAARETVGGLPVPGADVPYDYDPAATVDTAWNAATAKKPEHGGLIGKLMTRMDPERAAEVAKVPTRASVAAQQQAQQQAAIEAGAPATPAGGAGLPTPDTVGEVVVKPNPTKKVSDADTAIAMYRVAQKTGDKDGMEKALAAHQKAVQDEAVHDITFRARTWDGAVQLMHKYGDVNVDYEPVPGTDKAKITIDGEDAGTMSLPEARDNLIGMVMKNPDYAAAASLRRDQNDRLMIAARTDAGYKQASLAVQQQEANTHAQLAKSTIDQNAVETENLKAKTATQRSFRSMIADIDGSGDAFLNAPKLAAMGRTAYDPETKVVQGEDGTGKPVTIYPGEEIAKIEIQLATKRFQSSPYVKQGVLGVTQVGDRRYYVVKGIDGGGFTNIDAAENAARKLYPPKPAPAGK